ncbi:MAG: SBBP repeat-containing protein, partial [Abitibacteriaceae bacterium]|nr:SBBP repeat-containing protein [Abditibacteriaceae bacterium]
MPVKVNIISMRTHNTAPIIALALVALLLLASFFGALLRPANFYGADHPIGVASLVTQPPKTARLASFVPAAVAPGKRLQPGYGNLPLNFEMNQGQAAHPVKFMARGNGYGLFLTPTEAVLSLHRNASGKARRPSPIAASSSAILRMQLVQANAHSQVQGVDRLPGISNYLMGRDPKQWRTNVAHYARVRYADVYPGVDLVYYGNQRQLEYDFVVAPGADPAAIKLAYQGTQAAHINQQGDLVLETGSGAVVHHAPVVYQKINGQRYNIPSHYIIRNPQSAIRNVEVGFQLATYDKTQPVIIDPVLSYSTYLGGNLADQANAIAVDGAGNAYITGQTDSSNFPTANSTQTFGGGTDVFVTKLSSTGALVYSTFLGGSGSDIGSAIAVDSAGNAYITGQTKSSDFPLANAYQSLFGGGTDAFVTKLNASGSAPVYSTYLGGLSNDVGSGIAVDSSGSAYVTGTTNSANFPLNLSLSLLLFGGNDAFVTKFNPAGTALTYSTFFGGSRNDSGNGIAVDASGNAYIVGTTNSTDLTTNTSANFRSLSGGTDAFVAKFDSSAAVVYSLYLGGTGNENGNGITVDGGSNAYVTGDTNSTNFPTKNPLQASNAGGTDAFIAEINSTGSNLNASTYFGGSKNDTANAIALDSAGDVTVAGQTNSTNFPTTNAVQGTYGGDPNDAFVSTLGPSLASVTSSTYLGDSGNDIA